MSQVKKYSVALRRVQFARVTVEAQSERDACYKAGQLEEIDYHNVEEVIQEVLWMEGGE